MKKSIIYSGLAFAAVFALMGAGTSAAHAQMMGYYGSGSSATGTSGYGMMGGWAYPWTSSSSEAQMSASDTQMIAAGQALYEQLQSGQIQCSALTQDNYENLGEYFMQQVTGAGHPAMDAMISNMMGEQGDTAMHVAWGERYSGCNGSATLPGAWSGSGDNNYYGSMMGYYGGGNYGYGPYGGMMGYGGSWLGWIFMLLFWALVVIGIIVLIRWLTHGSRHGWHDHGHSALGILKERYAKGEIDKREFEEKKKDLMV